MLRNRDFPFAHKSLGDLNVFLNILIYKFNGDFLVISGFIMQ